MKRERALVRVCLRWRQTCRRCRQDTTCRGGRLAEQECPVLWTSPVHQWYECHTSPSNDTWTYKFHSL